jgi:ApaG protein
MYEATTRGVRVAVTPQYLDDKSDPDDKRWFWAYTIEIANLSETTVQLRTRHWRIIDAHGRCQEVRGPGVVGEEPVIPPGHAFEYTSGCPLATSSGLMVGEYEMEAEDGERFAVEIPAFSLDIPGDTRVHH